MELPTAATSYDPDLTPEQFQAYVENWADNHPGRGDIIDQLQDYVAPLAELRDAIEAVTARIAMWLLVWDVDLVSEIPDPGNKTMATFARQQQGVYVEREEEWVRSWGATLRDFLDAIV